MGQNIGFISFLPDGGHVLPLIRMATVFIAHGYNVYCYFPEESLKYANQYDVPVKSLGKFTAGIDKKIFTRLSKRSVFYNGFSSYVELEKGYLQPIKVTVAARMEEIKEIITRENLSLIIADSNIFNWVYMLLAASAKIPLVIHLSEGNCRYPQRPYVFTYGVTKHPPLMQNIIEITGFCFERLCLWSLIIRYFNLYQRITSLFQKPFPGINPGQATSIQITSGLGFIEREQINGLKKSKDDVLLFPPIPDRRTAQISPALQKWFSEREKPVVYISFGTMVQGGKPFFTKIIDGLKNLKISILWSASHDQRILLEEIGVLPDMRIEEFVAQSEILALEKVRCFITHGGAGSVQESLLSGKPMLCIPFLFDQPYNSSIVVSLGAGIKLWKNRVSSRLIKTSVSQLIHHPEYWDAAQCIKKQLQEVDGGEAIIRHFQKIGMLIPEEVVAESEI